MQVSDVSVGDVSAGGIPCPKSAGDSSGSDGDGSNSASDVLGVTCMRVEGMLASDVSTSIGEYVRALWVLASDISLEGISCPKSAGEGCGNGNGVSVSLASVVAFDNSTAASATS